MQITFDTTTITDDEVRGISALLYTVRAAAFDTGPFSESEMERAVEGHIAEATTLTTTKDFNEWVSEKGVKLTEETAKWVAGPIDTVATLDSTGLPWDERIHASSKALNADGTWRTKRGVDKALVASVEAELRGQHSYDSDVTPEAVQQVREAAAPALENADLEQIDPPVAPPAPPAPIAPLAPAVTESAVSPFVAIMKRVTAAQGARELTQMRVKELLESLDKKSIMDLRTDEDALASFAVLLDGEGV